VYCKFAKKVKNLTTFQNTVLLPCTWIFRIFANFVNIIKGFKNLLVKFFVCLGLGLRTAWILSQFIYARTFSAYKDRSENLYIMYNVQYIIHTVLWWIRIGFNADPEPSF
jgi:hypothetical protein